MRKIIRKIINWAYGVNVRKELYLLKDRNAEKAILYKDIAGRLDAEFEKEKHYHSELPPSDVLFE